jgi:hypothetical protein
MHSSDLFTKFKRLTPSYGEILLKYRKNIIGIDHISFHSLKKGHHAFDKYNYALIEKEKYEIPEYNVKINCWKLNDLINIGTNNNSAHIGKYNKAYAENVNKSTAYGGNYSYYSEYAHAYQYPGANSFIIPKIHNSYYIGYYTNQCDKINRMIDNVDNTPFGEIYTYNDYKYVYDRNPYVAWTMLFGNYINHVAFEVDDIEKLTYKMNRDGYRFQKTENGNIFNLSKDGKFMISRVTSTNMLYNFVDGSQRIPYTYIQLVERIDCR